MTDGAKLPRREKPASPQITATRTLPSLSMVTVSCPQMPDGITNIVLNQARAAELAMEHVSGLGHRRIAVIKGQVFSSDTEVRWASINSAAAKLKLSVGDNIFAQLEGDGIGHAPGYSATQQLLSGGAKITSLFACDDVSAIGASRALREVGLRVPHDVSVVGFDDIQPADYHYQNAGLTTVREPLRMMGMFVAEAVVQRITLAIGNSPAKQVAVDPESIVRESTCPPKGLQ